ncbi:DeoR/GlpR family DNA-binding transcription regulator [Oricola indica]|uniref:DeoR/GlpR family DNA-binding transcription regulator n=1 Tax=Oricola indica TaxID=2872591 RepID=UPI003CCB9297
MSMLPGERLDLIASRLQTDGKVVAVDLARELDVSEDTIRRDLRDLSARGLCQRVYGGALRPAVSTGTLDERSRQQSEAKSALARAAIDWIAEGSSVFLDAASTNLAIADALPRDFGLTCITNAPQIASALTLRGDCDVVSIGGLVDRTVGAAIGAEAINAARNFRPDICFLGACGVDPRAGISAVHAEDASFKRAIAGASAMTIVPVTTAKLMTAAPFHVLELADCTAVLVEADAPEAAVEACRAAGANIRRCGQ